MSWTYNTNLGMLHILKTANSSTGSCSVNVYIGSNVEFTECCNGSNMGSNIGNLDPITLDSSNDRVGINNTNPQYNLDVNGIIHTTNNIILDDNYRISFANNSNNSFNAVDEQYIRGDSSSNNTALYLVGKMNDDDQRHVFVYDKLTISSNLVVGNNLITTDSIMNFVGIGKDNP